ncbi:hypothetical protein [Streptomyces cyaneofuscatus]
MTADLSTAPGALTSAADTAPSVVQSIDWLAIAPPTLTALAALTVLAGLWPAILLGLTDPAVQKLLAGGKS